MPKDVEGTVRRLWYAVTALRRIRKTTKLSVRAISL